MKNGRFLQDTAPFSPVFNMSGIGCAYAHIVYSHVYCDLYTWYAMYICYVYNGILCMYIVIGYAGDQVGGIRPEGCAVGRER